MKKGNSWKEQFEKGQFWNQKYEKGQIWKGTKLKKDTHEKENPEKGLFIQKMKTGSSGKEAILKKQIWKGKNDNSEKEESGKGQFWKGHIKPFRFELRSFDLSSPLAHCLECLKNNVLNM